MRYLLLLSLTIIFTSCGTKKETIEPKEWAIKMAESSIQRNPEGWMLDFSSTAKWGYCQGLVCYAHEKLWKATGNKTFYDYAKAYADTIISADGSIFGYKQTNYNIDNINAGKILFDLYKESGEEKYAIAIQTLRDQMRTHPRTSEGGFWHKKRYPWQMWLDGLYMGSPFLAEYAKEFNEDSLFTDVALQIKLTHKHLLDSATGLYRHGWDERKEQEWANKTTGLSENVWGRGMGWYAMCLVDVLEFFPQEHPDRDSIVIIANHMAEMIEKYQDKESGLWYQVVDKGTNEGNYLESTASTMFVYFMFKAINNNYIDGRFLDVATKGYNGILQHFITKNSDGTINITNCCAGAGLGGKPYRSGAYDYYINEMIRDNDPKSVGPFIMLALEYDKMRNRE